jgi:hypothetical protein
MKILAFLFLFCSFVSFPQTNDDKNNDDVDVTVSIKPLEIKSGGTAQLIVNFKPKKGIQINLDPPIEIELEKSIVSKGKIEIPKMKKEAYLNPAKPLKQNFTLKKNISPGTHTLKGKLNYFYCSDAEGWCSRFTQDFQLNIKVIK